MSARRSPSILAAIGDAKGIEAALAGLLRAVASGTLPLDSAERLAALVERVGVAGAWRKVAERLDAIEATQSHRGFA